jgi:hypothetical protein
VAGTAPAGAKTGGRAGGLKPGILKGAIHGELLLMGDHGTTRTVIFDRGKITAISAGSITIARPDGVSVNKGLTGDTVFTGTPRNQLQPGAPVVVVSSGDTAERVISKGARLERRKERLERRKERLEQRQERLKPSSAVDDGLETILS